MNVSELVLGLVLGALLSIPIGLFVNLKTPALEQYLREKAEIRANQQARKSAVAAQKRIEQLRAELEETTHFANDKQKLVLKAAWHLDIFVDSTGSLFGTILLALVAFRFFEGSQLEGLFIFMALVMAYGAREVWKASGRQLRKLLEKVIEYENYKDEIEKQIAELEQVANQLPDQQQG